MICTPQPILFGW